MSSKVLQGGTVIAWDDEANALEILPTASILIVKDRIAAIARINDGLAAPADAEVIDVTGKIVSPGFVNTHCHMWQTAFRTMAPDIFIAQYFAWLSQGGQAKDSFSTKDIYLSCLEGYCEGLNAGVTSYVDHANNNWGAHAVRPSCDAAIDSEVSAVSMGLAFDGFSLSNDAEVQNLKSIARNLQAEVITTHYLGGPWAVGTNSPRKASEKDLQSLNTPTIFSHGGYVTESDIQALRDHDSFLAITPENEMSEGHGQTTSRLVHDHAALGTDTNWNISGDMMHQARLWLQSVRGANYQKTLDKGFTPRGNPMPVVDAFLLATRQGGRALRRNDIGVLQVGAKADIICLSGDSPNMVGWTNPVAAVILHANVGDIQHVLVDGQFRKRDGQLIMKNQDWVEVSASFAEVARRIQLQNASPPSLPKQFWGGRGEFADVETATISVRHE
ncbi:hypothetical protein LTR17_021639 [Elasticomyces elasticus]|nr:hypothetical protein LTR17_021639 [Elasticomyces elasticus]